MKNSTPWYNLYSTELKYNLSLTKSVYAKRVPLMLAGLSFFVFIVIFLNLRLDLSYIKLIAFSCLSAMAIYLLCLQFNMQARQFSEKAILISSSGVLSLASNRHYQLLPCSQVLPYVCRVNLAVVNERSVSAELTTSKTEIKFIFKDSLSEQSFRRLCRIIRTAQRS